MTTFGIDDRVLVRTGVGTRVPGVVMKVTQRDGLRVYDVLVNEDRLLENVHPFEVWPISDRALSSAPDKTVIRAVMTDAQRERLADGPAVTPIDRPIGDHTNLELAAMVLAHLGSTDAETPRRFLKAMHDLTCGETDEVDLKDLLRTFPLAEGADPGVVVVRAIPFASVCAHHALPFSGHVDVAYIPSKVIVGLSKIPRLVRHMSRRFSVQEGIGELVANALHEHLDALGVMVRITARHSCMSLRGAESPGEMRTCCVRGVFANDPSARAEALALIG